MPEFGLKFQIQFITKEGMGFENHTRIIADSSVFKISFCPGKL